MPQASAQSWSERLRRAWPLAAVLALSIAFRWPALAHPDETNSDAAVVGLQAMHALRGEWSWFLWGSGYQTSIDSAVAALVFAIGGATPRALMVSSLALHLALTGLAWSVLARRLAEKGDGVRAALAVLPLVFTSSPSQTYILYPPRQASLTIAVLALWAFDRAADSRRGRTFAIAGALLALACFADPYALVLAPPIAAFGVACAIDRSAPRASVERVGALAMGAALGAVPIAILRASARATHAQLALGASAIAHNARLLVDPCFPWAIGARAWAAPNAVDYAPWSGPPLVRAVELAGGTAFATAIALGGLCVFARRIPWSVRRLAIAGGLALPVTIAGFLASPMVVDLFSARYLAAIPLLAPFALAPLASLLGTRPFAALVAPCVLATGLTGWVGYGPFLRPHPRGPSEEARLAAELDKRGVHAATADYWVAYRMTLLTSEQLVVVPTSAAEDRYAPYRAAFDAAPLVAYVFDPARSRERESWMSDRIAAGETPFATPVEVLHVGRLRAMVLRRER